mgnify:CR=1 FL=1
MDSSKLKISKNNPRQINGDQFERLKQSIKEFPEMMRLRPIVYDPKTMEVLGGNMRLRAIRELNMKDIPDEWFVSADDLTDEQKREFVIKDNVGFGEWDYNILANEWDDLPLEDWGLDPIGFAKSAGEAEEDDYEIPDEIETDIVLGDLFQIGEHRLLCGDSTDSDAVAKLMNGEKADMVLTDPPYGMDLDTDYSKLPSTKCEGNKTYRKIEGDNKEFDPSIILSIFGYCKETLLFGADYYSKLLPVGSWYVWDKRVEEKFDLMFGSAFELIWSKARHKREIARFNNTLFSGEQDAKNKSHPSQKPVKLIDWFLQKISGNIIVDLYIGSGTTMVAAHQLDRKCYGMEIDPKYCQVIIDRMKALDPDIEVKKL